MKTMLHLAGYAATALFAFVFGASVVAIGSETTSASDKPSTSTVTSTATITDPGATTTTTAAPETSTKTKTATVTAEPPAPASAIPGDGTFAVGVDVEPGTYVSAPASSGNCYWARLSGSDAWDNIIDNNNSSGQSLVTIAAGDKFFESSGCSDWTKR
ncbi:hypothetical protein [Janibacter limosus]|uniref:hypothetical protein n=1 Tax=Janibacter limosus TaxID=53458 RepID=UPI00082DC9E3|nr:hypothetical protein [Janibacter limosus]